MTSSPSSRLARAGLLAGLMTLTAGVACVQDQDFLIVERALFFDGRDSCVLTGSEPTPLAMSVDVSFGGPIGMGFLVTNEQTPNAGSNTGIDDTEVFMETAEVTLSFTGGGVSTNTFEVPIPTNSIPGGESEIFLIQIPADVSASVSETMAGLPAGTVEFLEMEVIFKGRRTGQVGGTKLGVVETRPYTFPFQICYGCLQTCLPAEECGGVEGDAPVCPNMSAWAGVCGFAQNLTVFNPLCDAPD